MTYNLCHSVFVPSERSWLSFNMYESMDVCQTTAVDLVVRSAVVKHYHGKRIRKNEVSRICAKNRENNLKVIRSCRIYGTARMTYIRSV
jgi:hypothetical protein